MQKIILVAGMFLLTSGASVTAFAQVTDKKETPKTTTLDVWRQAIPEGEDNSNTPPVVVRSESKDNVAGEETTAQIEKRIIDLEERLTEGFKKRDAVALNHLLASDFAPAGVISGSQPNKTGFINWTQKNLEIKSHLLEKATVRVYQSTAVVVMEYKQQATVAGAALEGDFIATDVWIKRRNQWRLVSRHISQRAKA